MSRSRFQEAKRIYTLALERERAQRQSFVIEACAGDESLRKEVESLLACQTEAQEFFRAVAAHVGVNPLARESPIDFAGRTFSHYDIIEKIGQGGMGVVYKARDTHLDRFVALKVLPPEKVADPERKRRFAEEAKATSALNHPNIVTIHDIDTADGVTFIAMEFVQGRTLDRLIRDKGMVLNDTLKHGIQIADAMAAAHAAGIIHRDIKPANIMISETGLVKVLDFGLAKLTERAEGVAVEAIHTASPDTGAGVILGTMAYMSPEQAKGYNVDSRSDIFSFGLVLYEMTTGRRAFSGETESATLTAILREEPKPVSQVAPEMPEELDRIISRCLRKDRGQRFQYMGDLKVALEELKKQSDSGPLARAAPSRVRRPRRNLWVLGAFFVAALGLGAWFGLFRRPAAGPVGRVSLLAALPGLQTHSAFSPDAKQVAFVWTGERQDNYDIYVQRVGDATRRRLTSSPAFEYSPVWSPDARQIAFLRETPAGTEINLIPAAGGTEQRLHISKARCWWPIVRTLSRQFCGPAWSPDGKFLTVVDKESEQAPNTIFLFNIETREKRRLTTPPRGFEDGLSAFSPDGRTLAFARRSGGPLSDIFVLPLGGIGEPRQVTSDNSIILGMDWAFDRSIVFSSTRGGASALWRVASSGGTPERLPVGGSDAYWPSISRTGNRLAYSYGTIDENLWRVAAPGGGAANDPAAAPMRITHSPLIDEAPAFSPDGRKIAWTSMHSGNHQIWVCGSDGANPLKLTDFDFAGADAAQWSPDGRQIAFVGFSRGPTQIYVIGAEGGAPRRLTTGEFDEGRAPPSWSRDGKWIYFRSNRGDGDALWRVPATGGSPDQIARNGRAPVESFDGQFVYYAGAGAGIWKVPAGGGAPVLVAPEGTLPFFESLDGKFLYYRRSASIWKAPAGGGVAVPMLKTDRRAIWTFSAAGIYVLDPDAEGGPAIMLLSSVRKHIKVVRLPGEPDRYAEVRGLLAVSPDGRWILYHRRDRNDASIMLVENFR